MKYEISIVLLIILSVFMTGCINNEDTDDNLKLKYSYLTDCENERWKYKIRKI